MSFALHELLIQHFRNYSEQHLEFAPGLNLIEGQNGQGKTSLVEAIYYLCNLSSFRTHKLQQLIASQQSVAVLQGKFESSQVFHQSRIALSKQGRRVFLNQQPVSKTSSYVLSFSALAFTPNDVTLFKGAPSARRQFLDHMISLLDPSYVQYLQELNRVLEQKNALLKQKQVAQLDLWNQLLAKVSVPIVKIRHHWVEQFNEHLSNTFQQMSGRSESLTLKYDSTLMVQDEALPEEDVLKILQKQASREIRYGFSQVGPHRDDYALWMDDKNDREFFSQGELRITNLSLKMAINQILSAGNRVCPILIFDDLFSELDEQVNQSLLQYLKGILNQVFITSTTIPSYFDLPGKRIQICSGVPHLMK